MSDRAHQHSFAKRRQAATCSIQRDVTLHNEYAPRCYAAGSLSCFDGLVF